MADDRTYIKLHDGFDEHPKVAGLPDKAFRTYIEAVCYSARNLTDGRIPFAIARKLAPPRAWATLVDVGLIEHHDQHYSVHDYLEHQRSAEQVKQLKEARREAGKRGGQAKANGLASARGIASDLPKQTASKAVPDTEAETERTTTAREAAASSISDRFEEFWSAYPRKTAKRNAEKAWAAAVKRADPQVILDGLRRHKFSDDPQYVAHPATWLNGDRWADQQLSIVPSAANGHWTTDRLDAVLGPDRWRLPQPPSGLTSDERWEWANQQRAARRADRITQAETKQRGGVA